MPNMQLANDDIQAIQVVEIIIFFIMAQFDEQELYGAENEMTHAPPTLPPGSGNRPRLPIGLSSVFHLFQISDKYQTHTLPSSQLLQCSYSKKDQHQTKDKDHIENTLKQRPKILMTCDQINEEV